MTHNIAIEFDEFSKNYTEDMIGCVPHYLSLLSSFTENLPADFSPSSILDLGSGNGNVTAQLIPLFPAATFTLVDASAEMINLCRKQFKDYDVVYANSYFKNFQFEKDRYDLVVAGFSLHHCDEAEKETLFKNIFNSLKKGGIFSFSDLMINKSDPAHPALLTEWEALVKKTFPDGEKWKWLMDHYEKYDKPTAFALQVEWLKKAGFTSIQTPFKEGYWINLQANKPI